MLKLYLKEKQEKLFNLFKRDVQNFIQKFILGKDIYLLYVL